ncbi:MAG: hypothetical protein GQ569_10575 [Methylococcaceae bacterium]|nr:hypothetical protein [Methylococcaceae bacterium]
MNKYIISLLLSFVCFPLSADIPASQIAEVEHLLNFIKKSPCIINRNGSKHKGKEAVEHIFKKYDYFKGDIKNTEDFIKYSATKSTLSGTYYYVSCPEQAAIKTQDWLLGELQKFRVQQEK